LIERQVLRVSWSNELILQKTVLQSNFIRMVKQRKLQYLGHIVRKLTRLETDVIEATTVGSRAEKNRERLSVMQPILIPQV